MGQRAPALPGMFDVMTVPGDEALSSPGPEAAREQREPQSVLEVVRWLLCGESTMSEPPAAFGLEAILTVKKLHYFWKLI